MLRRPVSDPYHSVPVSSASAFADVRVAVTSNPARAIPAACSFIVRSPMCARHDDNLAPQSVWSRVVADTARCDGRKGVTMNVSPAYTLDSPYSFRPGSRARLPTKRSSNSRWSAGANPVVCAWAPAAAVTDNATYMKITAPGPTLRISCTLLVNLVGYGRPWVRACVESTKSRLTWRKAIRPRRCSSPAPLRIDCPAMVAGTRRGSEGGENGSRQHDQRRLGPNHGLRPGAADSKLEDRPMGRCHASPTLGRFRGDSGNFQRRERVSGPASPARRRWVGGTARPRPVRRSDRGRETHGPAHSCSDWAHWIPAFAGMTAPTLVRHSRVSGNDSPHGASRNALFRHSREGGNPLVVAHDPRRGIGHINHRRPCRHSREGGNPLVVAHDPCRGIGHINHPASLFVIPAKVGIQ